MVALAAINVEEVTAMQRWQPSKWQRSQATLKRTSMAETQKSTVTPQNVKYLENYDVRIGDLNGFGLRAPPRAQIR